jgi:hypothetical protein
MTYVIANSTRVGVHSSHWHQAHTPDQGTGARILDKTNNSTDLQTEHRRFRNILLGVADSLASSAERRELTVRFTDLRETLESRFSFEEKDGYFESALSAAPWLAHVAGCLLRQHALFLEELGNIEAILPGGGVDTRRELQAAYALFRRCLERHENQENRLMQSAFYRDISAGD